MSRFIKSILSNVIAAVISTIILIFMMIVVIGAIIAGIGAPKPFPSKAVLEINMAFNLTDGPQAGSFEDFLEEALTSNSEMSFHIREVVESIQRAAEDDRIKGILLTGSVLSGNLASGYPALHELRQALYRFRESGKPIISYTVDPSLRDLYVHSVASDATINRAGTIILPGLYWESPYFASALEKLGVGVQVVRVGDYKDAVESLTRTSMSKESKESTQWILDRLWAGVLADIATSKPLDPQLTLSRLASQPVIASETAVEWGLYDRIITRGDLERLLISLGSEDEEAGSFAKIDLADYIAEETRTLEPGKKPGTTEADTIAIVYAEGMIVDGWGEKDQAGGDRIASLLRKARNDKSVKAIVLRINSPGGSATASEIIQEEILEVKESGKPIIVSMGSYAASGGYFIAQTADHIVAHPNTITGSIGIFGVLFNLGDGASKLGITFDEVKTMPHSDLLSISKPKSAAQIDLIQNLIEAFYTRWVDTIAQNRPLSPDQVQSLAKGRVWTGRDAVENQLADELGGISDAVRIAATRAGLEEGYRIKDFPEKKTMEAIMAEAFGMPASALTPIISKSRTGPSRIEARIRETFDQLRAFNDPAHAYALCPLRYE